MTIPLAWIESPWHATLQHASVFRYEIPSVSFTSLDDAGMWVSRKTVVSISRHELRDLPTILRQQAAELRVVPTLATLLPEWRTTLHASGIRLRNASRYPAPFVTVAGWNAVRLADESMSRFPQEVPGSACA